MTDKDVEASESDEARDASGEEAQATEPDIDSLLAEWSEEKDESASADESVSHKADAKPEIDPNEFLEIKKWKETREAQERSDAISANLKSAAEKVLEHSERVSSTWDRETVEDLIAGRCAKDERWATAFFNQKRNPESWDRLITAVAKELDSKAVRDTSGERQAAESAARGVSHQPPADDKPDIAGMSHDKWEAYKRERFGNSVPRSDGLF